MEKAKVILIGGAPGVGKTTLGRALAFKLGTTSLSIDDLLTAAKVVTTRQSHPGLHVMSVVSSIEYFTTSSVDQLTADATIQHDATWAVVEKVIRNHATWGSPIVIDGWALRPNKVAQLELSNVASFWLVAAPSVLEKRESKNPDFFHNSSNPERMLENFLGRSLWYNDLLRQQATEWKQDILHQDGQIFVEELCNAVLELVRDSSNGQMMTDDE